MAGTASPERRHAAALAWRELVEPFERPSRARSIWQLANSIGPFLLLWGVMIWTIQYSYLLTLAIAVPTAGFMVRTFIISHDCGHGAFFRSPAANHFWGVISGMLTLMPYRYWRHEHGLHHATSGNLDRRGTGDIWTLTVREYQQSPWWRRAAYRLYRNPLLMLGPGALIVMTLMYRLPTSRHAGRRERLSVLATNLGLLAIILAMCTWLGAKTFFMIFLPVVIMSSSAGVWLFYVQHQFEGVRWTRHTEWNFLTQAIESSSFYRLPRLLQWFTGNIGFHHVHHLSPRIPNYYLERCHQAHALFQRVRTISLRDSFKSLRLRLWDEETHQLVGFDILRQVRT